MSTEMAIAAQFLLVLLGGALGGLARHWVSGAVARRFGQTFPWGTLTVNVSGALTLGLLGGAALVGGVPAASPGWAFFAVGVLGSYTTVSSFSLQTFELARGGELRAALANLAYSFVLCLAAAAGGFFVAFRLLGGAGTLGAFGALAGAVIEGG